MRTRWPSSAVRRLPLHSPGKYTLTDRLLIAKEEGCISARSVTYSGGTPRDRRLQS